MSAGEVETRLLAFYRRHLRHCLLCRPSAPSSRCDAGTRLWDLADGFGAESREGVTRLSDEQRGRIRRIVGSPKSD